MARQLSDQEKLRLLEHSGLKVDQAGDISDWLDRPPTDPRPLGQGERPSGLDRDGTRVLRRQFTQQEDEILRQWCLAAEVEGVSGTRIFGELETVVSNCVIMFLPPVIAQALADEALYAGTVSIAYLAGTPKSLAEVRQTNIDTERDTHRRGLPWSGLDVVRIRILARRRRGRAGSHGRATAWGRHSRVGQCHIQRPPHRY